MARKRKTASTRKNATQDDSPSREPEVRIIGGQFRGRRLDYHGDPVVRPMKHSTREAIFNLVGTESIGAHAIDLFAGTGALGLEAISRGAVGATFIERHVPTARVLKGNIATLEVAERCQVLITSAFLWGKRDLPSPENGLPADSPWLVFCSPPYAFYTDRCDEMLDLIARIQEHAPAGSLLVVEADDQLDISQLTGDPADFVSTSWDVRTYFPAVVGIWRKPA
jgi:16S rRNA (guanine966-N2)-methyltransferase